MKDGERKPQAVACVKCGHQTPVIVADPYCFRHKVRHPNGEMHK